MILLREDGARLVFDQLQGTDVAGAARVTEHPVEVGAPLVDHAQVQAFAFGVRVVVTETPWATAPGEGGPDRIAAAASWLEASAGLAIDVAGDARLGVVTDCLLESWSYRLEQAGRAVFDLRFRQVRRVEAQSVLLPARILRPPAASTSDLAAELRARQEAIVAGLADEVDAGVQSTASSAFDAAAGLFRGFFGGR